VESAEQTDRIASSSVPLAGESNLDYRARVAMHRAEILERRHQELNEQASTMIAPAARIKIWERLHQVVLPRTPTHKVLTVIAAHTGLSIEEVRHEQQQRVAGLIKPLG
jgi:hypothetical protein